MYLLTLSHKNKYPGQNPGIYFYGRGFCEKTCDSKENFQIVYNLLDFIFNLHVLFKLIVCKVNLKM